MTERQERCPTCGKPPTLEQVAARRGMSLADPGGTAEANFDTTADYDSRGSYFTEVKPPAAQDADLTPAEWKAVGERLGDLVQKMEAAKQPPAAESTKITANICVKCTNELYSMQGIWLHTLNGSEDCPIPVRALETAEQERLEDLVAKYALTTPDQCNRLLASQIRAECRINMRALAKEWAAERVAALTKERDHWRNEYKTLELAAEMVKSNLAEAQKEIERMEAEREAADLFDAKEADD